MTADLKLLGLSGLANSDIGKQRRVHTLGDRIGAVVLDQIAS